MDDYKELIDRLTADRAWAQANEWESPICLQDDLSAAIEAVEKLKAYEDAGLEPEKVMFLKDIVEDAFSEKPDFTNHLRDLLQAEKDGRLMVLPCKVGDTVWVIWGKDVIYYIVDRIHILANNQVQIRAKHHVIDNVYLYPDMFGKTVFLTREEAEAALGGKGGES